MGKKVDMPKWLEGLPLAPEFRPTDTEFADPIAYISKIEKEASAFGICKVIPPLPKPSKKYVFSNLNRCLSRELEPSYVKSCTASDGMKLSSEDRGTDGKVRAVFTTRQLELGHSVKKSKGTDNVLQQAAQKQVWQSGEVYTLEQFELKSKAFSRSVLCGLKEVSPLVIEAAFWKAASEKPIYVEYANDVPGSGFAEPEGVLRYFYGRSRRRRRKKRGIHGTLNSCGSVLNSFSESGGEITGLLTSSLGEAPQFSRQGTEQSSGEMEGTSGWRLSNSPWNLQVISRSAGSLTRFMLDDIPGVTSPMVYIGMLFSWFAWHVEDHELHSLNFLHTGSPKTWYAIPGSDACTFEEVIRTQAYGGEIDYLAALTLLGEKTTLLSPEVVVGAGIPCCRLVQNPGEFVVTFPRAYHIGFSHGFNCGEAANFGTPQWLNVAKDAAVRRAAMDHLPMLSHQQLLYLLTMSFVSRVPRSLLPGVRNSRLKNRQKEARELLVKKAFIHDMLNENKLLSILLGRDPDFRAVLWDPDSLLPFNKQSPSRSGDATIASEPFSIPNTNDYQNNQVGEMSSYLEAINDLYWDCDLSDDFQVDSGALVCVACGILGFPFMSVVQPSSKADMENLPALHPSVAGAAKVAQSMESKASNLHNNNNNNDFVSDLVKTCDKRWNISDEFLRPRILCLEHAVQTEEILRANGGANMLIICHSDYPKIKANAVAVSEEIGAGFNYKEVAISSASVEDLNLIRLAIDDEEHVQCREDWTSMLGINLQYCVKARKDSPPKQIQHPFFPGGFSSSSSSCTTSVSGISNSKWYCKRSRSKRGSGYTRRPAQTKNDRSMEGKFRESSSVIVKEVILQYSRRKDRIKSRDPPVGACRSTSNYPSKENSSANCIDSSGANSIPDKPPMNVIVGCTALSNQELHNAQVGMGCNPGTDSNDNLTGSGSVMKANVGKGLQNGIKVNKRKRDGDNGNGFVRSPCEGLRSRTKNPLPDTDTESAQEKSSLANKKAKRVSNSCRKEVETMEEESYSCDVDHCKLRFATRAELSLHKRNKCHYEGCGKRFRSHRYATVHQRVHEKDRPFKCTWKGCNKSFKWAWARTEHLRLHTGERPYECKVDGCGLTFRFVSDYNRHRRKTGHYVNPSS
ncbi:hypothetical protein Dimus_011493 [Dionaea muscipula]